MEFEKRWRTLVDACLAGKLMPFLGAGVSICAKLDGKFRTPRYGSSMPKTNELTGKIIEDIEKLPRPDWAKAELDRMMGRNDCKQDCPNRPSPSFADAAQLFIDLHPDGEHGLYSDGGPLDIRLFLSIQPTLAHRAVAWLVRENLFSEVITTNYDRALEAAFRESFDAGQAKDDVYHAISDHKAYRKRSPCAQRDHEGASVPVLRVYKINGCSELYQSRRGDGAPGRINAKQIDTDLGGPGFLVITDRHLQDFGRRQWAQDLFRDRFRSRQIVFSGFGAEEPQIRFTALRVIEEFSISREDSPEKDTEAPPLPHCFLQCFDPDLKASQLQIAKAAAPPTGSAPNPGAAVFTKSDLSHFSPSPEDKGLTSSLFWQKLHRDVATRLIQRRLERCEFFSWLRERDHLRPLSRAIAHGLRQRIAHETPDEHSTWLAGFLGLDPHVEHTLRLMVLAWRVRQPVDAAAQCPSGYYEELDRGDSMPLKLLYLFHLLNLDADAAVFAGCAYGFWLQLDRPRSDGQPPSLPRWVFVTSRPPRKPPEPPKPSPRLVTCLVLCPTSNDPEERRTALSEKSVATWHFITLPECLSKVARDSSERSLSDSLRIALLDSHAPRPRVSFYESVRRR